MAAPSDNDLFHRLVKENVDELQDAVMQREGYTESHYADDKRRIARSSRETISKIQRAGSWAGAVLLALLASALYLVAIHLIWIYINSVIVGEPNEAVGSLLGDVILVALIAASSMFAPSIFDKFKSDD